MIWGSESSVYYPHIDSFPSSVLHESRSILQLQTCGNIFFRPNPATETMQTIFFLILLLQLKADLKTWYWSSEKTRRMGIWGDTKSSILFLCASIPRMRGKLKKNLRKIFVSSFALTSTLFCQIRNLFFCSRRNVLPFFCCRNSRRKDEEEKS